LVFYFIFFFNQYNRFFWHLKMMFYPKEDVRFVAVRKPSDKSILRRLSSAYYYHEPHSIYRCRFNPSIDLWNYLGFCDEAGFFYLYDTMFFEQKNDPKLLFKLQLHKNAVCDFAWHPCGRGEVLTGSADERIILTDCNTAKAVQCFHGHSYSIRSLSWCAENTNLFASGGRDGALRIWDVRLRAGCVSTIAKAHYFGDFQTASSSTLCNQKRTKTNLRKILMSDVRRSGASLNVPVTGVHFHNQHYVLSGAYTNTGIRIWDLRKLLQANKAVAAVDIWPYPSPRNSNYSRYGYTTFCVDSSRSLLFVPCTDNTVYQYSLSSFNPKPIARHTGVSINTYYVQCAVCPYAPYLLCGSSNNKAMIWNINESGDPQFSLNDFEGRDANSVTWNHYGQLVTCCDPPSWRIWTVYSEKQQQQLDMERRNLVLRIQENQRLESLQSERVQQQQQPLEEPIWFASQARSPSRMQALAPVQSSPMRRYLHQRNKRPASTSPLSTAALDVNQPGPSRPVSSSRAPTTTPARKRVRTTNTYYEIKKHFKFAGYFTDFRFNVELGLAWLARRNIRFASEMEKMPQHSILMFRLFCLFSLELLRSVMGDKPVTPQGSFFRVYSQDRQYRDLAMTGDKASKLACGPTKRAFDHDVVWATDHPAAGPLLDELVDAMVYAKCDVNVPDDANMSVMMTLRTVNMEKPQIKQDAASGMRSSALDPERMKSVLQAMQKSGAQGVSQDNIDRALQLIELALKEKRAISIHEMEEVLRLVEFNVFIGADGLKQMFERLVNDRTLTEGQANGILQPLLAKAASKADGKLPMQEVREALFFYHLAYAGTVHEHANSIPIKRTCNLLNFCTVGNLHYLFKVMRRSGARRVTKDNIDRALRMIDLVVKEKREISVQEMEEILCIVESNVFIGIDGLRRMFEHLVNKKTLTDAEAIGILPSLLVKAAAKSQKKIPLQNITFTTLVHNLHYLFKITVQISNHSVIIRRQCGSIPSNSSTNLSDLLYYFNARSLCKKLKNNNILYPKEDKSRRCLLYACRNCSYVTDDIVSVCVYTNKLRREIDELAQVNVDVIYDPTLPKTDDHSCPLCNNSEAVFFQSQNTKAEDNMRLYYFVMKSELKQDEHALKEEILGFMNKIGLNKDGKNKNSSRISTPVRRETKPGDSAWNNNSSGSKNKQQQQQQRADKLLPTKIKTEDLNEHPASESSVQRWFDAKFTDVVGSQPLSEHSLMKMEAYAKQLFQNQAVNYEKETMNKKNNSNQLRWMNSVASGGTLSDRVAALGMLVQQSPLHNLKHLDTLLNKVTKKNRHEALIAADVAKDLFIEELLPDRKLIPFKSRPYVEIENTKGQSKAAVDRKLLLWQFESELKMKYQQFLHAVEQLCHDTVEAVRLKGCILLVDLLIAKAEQEQFILSSLVNKLGDQSVKVATQVVKLIGRLFVAHPNMKVVVVDELEKLIYRKNITPCAQFYAICALLKVPLNRNNDEDLACKILNVYFDLFKIVIQSDVENQRLLRHLLLGTNVAFSYSKGKFDRISEEVDTLYKIAATSSLYINLQALALLFQVLDVKAEISDRFYRSLYRTMLVPELLSSSRCHAMFFHLLFKSMSQDFSDQRIRAFVKRLLQVCLMAPAPFICAALLVISQALHGRLKRFIAITDQWVEDDHEEQEKVDDEEEKEIGNGKKKQTPTESNNTNDNKQNANNIYGNVYGSREYNIAGREPLHANADRESLVELLLLRNHYHPTVAVFAENLLKGNHINYSGNPLDDFSLMHFLDRFVFKNPKKSISENVEEKNTEKRGYKRKIYDPWSLRSLPVTSSAYALHHKSHVPPDEKYLHSFMTNANVKRAEEQLSEESDIESVNSEDEIGNKRRRRRRRRSKRSEDSDDSDNPSDSSGDESDFEAGRSKLNTAALTGDNDDSTDGGVLDDDDATTAAEEFGEILENDDEEDEKKKHDRKRKAYKKFQKLRISIDEGDYYNYKLIIFVYYVLFWLRKLLLTSSFFFKIICDEGDNCCSVRHTEVDVEEILSCRKMNLSFYEYMSSPRGTIVVNEMDVADADSWVELSHDSECGSSITFLTDPSGAHGSPHKYTPPGGQTSPVLQFDGDLERVKFQLCRQFSNIQGGKSAWLSDWSSRPEVVPPLQYRRSGTIVRTPPNSPFGSSEVETSDQSKPWFSLRHSRFVRHDWFSLEVLSVYILGNVLSFLFGVCIGLAICRKGRSCCGTHFLP
ncbi:CCAAT/enhancer-binding protein zeta, partial [Trichinella spiralis]